MPRRVGIFGVSEETLQLMRLLVVNPQLDLTGIWDPQPEAAAALAARVAPEIAGQVASLVSGDLDAFVGDGHLDFVIEGGVSPTFARRFPHAAERGVQILSPLTARLLWGYETATQDRKAELLTALSEVVESVELTIDSDVLFTRMLEIAVGVTGAEGGSLMLLDPERRELWIRVAIGVEEELWQKIRVPLGDGIAGRVAQEARSLLVSGRADRHAFQIVRERLDVESALCVPLVVDGNVIGVLNLHHSTRRDAFSREDLHFMERVARLDAQIIARAEEHETLRNQAARYDAVRNVRQILGGPSPLQERLRALCAFAAERVGGGIASVYLKAADDGDLRLGATSLEGGGLGGEYRIVEGQGIDGAVAARRQPSFLRGADGAIAYSSLPLIAGDRLVGVLSIQSGARPPRGRGAQETLLELAAAVAEGVAQAERETRMAVHANRVNAINETGIRMLSSKELNEVVRLATSSIAMILEADHAILRLQDDETKRFVIRSYFGAADGGVQERLFRLDKQVCVETIRRRTPIRIADLREHPAFESYYGEFHSFLCAPLRRLGRVVGTLSVYDKVATDQFYASAFEDEDLQIFTRFLTYVERGVEGALAHSQARQHRNFDEETGLPNASYLGKRIQEEIARAAGREGALAVAICRIENLDEIGSRANPAQAHRVTLRTADALRSHLRDFDVLGRTGSAEFTVLLPEPGPSPGERIFELARAVADEISKEESLNDPVRVALAFGYAVHPADGSNRDSLLVQAAEPRIRMV
jgi:diguanylate cyclase (GGDEF)-like protein